MKIVITTLLWKRYDLFDIWAQVILNIICNFANQQVKISVVVAGSENQVSKKLVEQYGFEYIETPNTPLSRKANLRLQKCKELNPDYILFLGSDDLISCKTFKYLLKQMRKGYDAIYNMDLYIYDTISGIASYNKEYSNHREGEPKAPGKCFSKRLLNKLRWKLWDENLSRNLDGNLQKSLKKVKHSRHLYWLKKEKLMIVDIKDKNSITPFSSIPEENYIEINSNQILNQFPQGYKLLLL